jgi:zinc transport system ATP-binding protein
MDIVSLKKIKFGYSYSPVLEDVSFTIKSGEFVGITGPNGASKSTMLKVMLGLLKPWEGYVDISKQNSRGESLTVGYIPQQIASFNTGFPSTVWELVRSGRYLKKKWYKKLTQDDKEQIEKAIRMVGMWDYRYDKIGALSGGQKQRIVIAKVLTSEPDLLVLDEPTTGMDSDSRKNFYKFIYHQVKKHGMTVLMVTHEHDDVKNYLDKTIQLERGENGGWKCLTLNSCNEHFGQVD